MSDFNYINSIRIKYGFYTVDEIQDSICKNNVVFDPLSILVSKRVVIGSNNVFYPGVCIQNDDNSQIFIGDNNIFSYGTHLIAENGGRIFIGNSNQFLDGIISIRSNYSTSCIKFSDYGRYDGRINIFGICEFDSGSQLIGSLNVFNCTLLGGKDYKEPNPDERAGLLKGIGNAKNLVVKKGMVINGEGKFNQEDAEFQSNYHKKM